MAEAQGWEGVEEPPPEPTEAQRRAAERAEEVRRMRKVRPWGSCSVGAMSVLVTVGLGMAALIHCAI